MFSVFVLVILVIRREGKLSLGCILHSWCAGAWIYKVAVMRCNGCLTCASYKRVDSHFEQTVHCHSADVGMLTSSSRLTVVPVSVPAKVSDAVILVHNHISVIT